jgi:wyosine [tRNA(Phe)-imidazoG37] synthetase (radical SAM superfamily)
MDAIALKDFRLSDGVTYGPVKSRRLGSSLGVNILPFGVKVCSFNCNYCQCGWTTDLVDDRSLAKYRFPGVDEVASGLRAALKGLNSRGERLDCITLAGNGEPTLHPDFAGVVRGILAVRDEEMPGVRCDILSNAAHLDRPGVIEGLNLLDERFLKLDAGTEEQFLGMNSPVTEVGIWDVLQGMKKVDGFVIQAMFTRGRRDNTTAKAVADWIAAVARAKPKAVQIYSVDRYPADVKILPVDRATLDEIAAALTRDTGIPAEVFG